MKRLTKISKNRFVDSRGNVFIVRRTSDATGVNKDMLLKNIKEAWDELTREIVRIDENHFKATKAARNLSSVLSNYFNEVRYEENPENLERIMKQFKPLIKSEIDKVKIIENKGGYTRTYTPYIAKNFYS